MGLEKMNSCAIILAAGASLRMGKPKQMLDIGGEKLLIKTVKAVLQTELSRVAVILGSDEEAHREILKGLPIELVYNADWKSGMGSSLKSGMRHLTAGNHSLEAVIVSVCDQPLLTSDTISNLLKKYQETGKQIIASRYSQMPGVPVLFGKPYFESLTRLPDDQGAKKIILQNLSDVCEVDFPGGEIDLDTLEDYRRFQLGSEPS